MAHAPDPEEPWFIVQRLYDILWSVDVWRILWDVSCEIAQGEWFCERTIFKSATAVVILCW